MNLRSRIHRYVEGLERDYSIMRTKQLAIFLTNKPGVLAEVCKTLAEKNINIMGLCISDTVDHAVVRLVVDEHTRALHLLGERGTLVVDTDILAVKLSNRAAALSEVAEKLASADINIEYAYGSGEGAEGTLYFRVSDLDRAEEVLRA